MKKRNLFVLLTICFLASCGTKPEEVVEDNKQAVTSVFPALNSLSTFIAEAETNEDKLPLLIKRAHWYLDHSYHSDLQSDAEKIYAIDSTLAHRNALYALSAIEKGDYLLAKNFSDAAMLFKNGKDEANYAKAELEFAGKQLTKSLETVNIALKINQYHYRAYYLKGRIYLQAGDTANGVSSLRTAVELNPNFYKGFKLLALTYSQADTTLYKQYIEAAKRVEPKNAEPLFMLADFNYRNGRMSEAKQLYKESIEADKKYEFSYFNLGVIYLSEDLALDSALDCFKTCVELVPNYTNAWYNMGICYEYMDSTEQAKKSYEKVLELNPAFASATEALEKL